MIAVAVVCILIAAVGAGIIVGYEWGREAGAVEERARVDRWHTRRDAPRSLP